MATATAGVGEVISPHSCGMLIMGALSNSMVIKTNNIKGKEAYVCILVCACMYVCMELSKNNF